MPESLVVPPGQSIRPGGRTEAPRRPQPKGEVAGAVKQEEHHSVGGPKQLC